MVTTANWTREETFKLISLWSEVECVVVSVSVAQFLAVSVLVSTYDAFLACLLFLWQKISSKTVVNKLTTNPSLTIHGKRTNYNNNNNIQYVLLQMCYLRVRSRSVNGMRFRTVPYRTVLAC